MFGLVSKRKYETDMSNIRKELIRFKIKAVDNRNALEDLISQIRNLRANCFLTNEKGHRVRYYNASAEVQAKAEGRENGK